LKTRGERPYLFFLTWHAPMQEKGEERRGEERREKNVWGRM
jgi:hypothetical protein